MKDYIKKGNNLKKFAAAKKSEAKIRNVLGTRKENQYFLFTKNI